MDPAVQGTGMAGNWGEIFGPQLPKRMAQNLRS